MSIWIERSKYIARHDRVPDSAISLWSNRIESCIDDTAVLLSLFSLLIDKITIAVYYDKQIREWGFLCSRIVNEAPRYAAACCFAITHYCIITACDIIAAISLSRLVELRWARYRAQSSRQVQSWAAPLQKLPAKRANISEQRAGTKRLPVSRRVPRLWKLVGGNDRRPQASCATCNLHI